MAKDRKFILLFSECGEFTHATTASNCKVYNSLDAAKKAASVEGDFWAESNNSNKPDRSWVVEVLAEGFPSGFTWS